MGGRGSGSGGGGGHSGGGQPLSAYDAILEKIALSESNPAKRAAAQLLIDTYGSQTTNSVQQQDMTAAESMHSVMVNGVKVNYATVDNRTLDAIANIAELFPQIVDTLDRWTTEITLATAPATAGPTAIATSGAGDGRIVVYNNLPLDKVTLVHEVTHNFINEVLSGYDGLEGGTYQDAVDNELPAPYPQGGGLIREDFAESTALFLLDPADFKANWPQRATEIEKIITWEPE